MHAENTFLHRSLIVKSQQNIIELVTRPERNQVVLPLHQERQPVPPGTQEDRITEDLQEELLVALDPTDLQADLPEASSSSRVPK